MRKCPVSAESDDNDGGNKWKPGTIPGNTDWFIRGVSIMCDGVTKLDSECLWLTSSCFHRVDDDVIIIIMSYTSEDTVIASKERTIELVTLVRIFGK